MNSMGGEKDIPVLAADWPFLGHLTTFMSYPPDNHFPNHTKTFAELQSSSFIVRAPGIPARTYILTIDPDIVKHITSSKFGEIYEKGPKAKAQYQQFLGNGIFNVNGTEWQRHRNVTGSLFHTTSLREYISIFEENAKRIFATIREISQNSPDYQNRGIDMQDYFMRYTLDSFAEIGFGVKLRSIEEEVNHFAIAFDKVQTQSERRGRLGDLWPLWEKISPDRDYEQKLAYMNQTVNSIIETRMNQDNETLAASSDALSAIILKIRTEDAKYTNEELRDFVMNFLIAGRDTTAMLLTWTFYFLAVNPDVEAKVIAEINDVLGDEPLTFDNIKKLTYLKWVLQETLRLRPPVPVDGYTAKKDDVLPGGFRVKCGWEIYYISAIMHLRDDYFERPNDFWPERYKEPNGCKVGMNHSSVNIPFHFGPRTCLGREMAYEEAKIMVCATLREGIRFRLHNNFCPEIKQSIILTAKNGMWMDISGP
eukprot:CAMPEP_0117017186 /NCGR_PEP_ID=MMETSP0472-20121206/13457_1 /TAXON_ID=693140 ORGANISM="Tiarina fusus, Strain LIS" /NCGR_SAMPLE_ID=MMETSP0472 /ASSEMBLY_ACC=CAM_ASM_000603 /LENGTH=479 /DNA_ID=CAMNT_0004721485 /DNA_START=24 /DNA_END=1460 /DNA_ORIENTATION=-